MRSRRAITLLVSTMLMTAACSAGTTAPTGSQPASQPATAAPTEPATAPAEGTPSAAPTEVATAEPTETATQEPSVAPSDAPSGAVPSLSATCQKDQLALKNPPRLTLSTDIPAFPPWWGGDPETQYPDEPEGAPEWELSDPYSREGYESATAYAVAEVLGFAPDEVDWVPNAVFEQAFAPGDKPFDFHLAQISIRPERAEAVDFSDSYLDANQAVLALADEDITGATTIRDLKDHVMGAAANTTSFALIEEVIQPEQEPLVFSDNATALTALQNGQIDGLVVDVQTAIYMRDAQLEDFETPDPEAVVVGQFADTEQVDEVGMVLEKDSPLTPCVNEALAIIKANGTLDAIYEEWISTGQEIPFFE